MLRMPQRLAKIAPHGTLLKRTMSLEALRQPEAQPSYLAMIRLLPCLKCGLEDSSEAAHIRMNSGAHGKHNGMGKKPDPRWTVPLCAACHREDNDSQHKVGELAFWNLLGINPLLVATRLYGAKGDVVRMRAIVLSAIAERQS
jgi:hypothetical protein